MKKGCQTHQMTADRALDRRAEAWRLHATGKRLRPYLLSQRDLRISSRIMRLALRCTRLMRSLLIFLAAALCEIAGCFSFWAWLRQHRSPLWLIPAVFHGALCLAPHSRRDKPRRPRYAAYGGIYIAASLLWMWAVERSVPDRFDLLGASICLIGASVILLAARLP
jgi:small multidrug resistance family-3 protein